MVSFAVKVDSNAPARLSALAWRANLLYHRIEPFSKLILFVYFVIPLYERPYWCENSFCEPVSLRDPQPLRFTRCPKAGYPLSGVNYLKKSNFLALELALIVFLTGTTLLLAVASQV